MIRFSPIFQNTAIIFLVNLTLHGCALVSGDTDAVNRFDIVVVPSDHAHPERIIVSSNESGLLISGEIHKKFHGPGKIRGHVDIELVANNGTVLAIGSTRYFRPSRLSRVSLFSVEILVTASKVRKILVRHHAPAS